MRVLITGATGLVGKVLVNLCHQKSINVNYLTTSTLKLSTASNYQGYYWNPKNNDIDLNCFKDVDAIIHLAGASVSKRWTAAYKKEILESRTKTTKLLLDTIKTHNIPIRHIISASAIGIYPSNQTNFYEETHTEISTSFLGSVVKQWEDAVDKFKHLDCKVTKLRIGLVLSSKGGALPEIIKPIKLGAGAAFGSGKQWQSWIHINDLARLFLFCLEEELEGIFNAVAPNPISNKELTKQAAKILNRVLVLPNIPKLVMKLTLGDMHMVLYESQRVSSKKIETYGFSFNFVHLKSALEDLIVN